MNRDDMSEHQETMSEPQETTAGTEGDTNMRRGENTDYSGPMGSVREPGDPGAENAGSEESISEGEAGLGTSTEGGAASPDPGDMGGMRRDEEQLP
jgi:hypothetical protein